MKHISIPFEKIPYNLLKDVIGGGYNMGNWAGCPNKPNCNITGESCASRLPASPGVPLCTCARTRQLDTGLYYYNCLNAV